MGRVRCRTQDVTDLGGFREGMQVGGSCGVAGGGSSVSGDFGGRILRGSVRVQCGDPLQFRSRSAVRECPRSVNGDARSGILRVGVLEEGQYFLCTFRRIAGDGSQLIEGQLEVSSVYRHDNNSRPWADLHRMSGGEGTRLASCATDIATAAGVYRYPFQRHQTDRCATDPELKRRTLAGPARNSAFAASCAAMCAVASCASRAASDSHCSSSRNRSGSLSTA